MNFQQLSLQKKCGILRIILPDFSRKNKQDSRFFQKLLPGRIFLNDIFTLLQKTKNHGFRNSFFYLSKSYIFKGLQDNFSQNYRDRNHGSFKLI